MLTASLTLVLAACAVDNPTQPRATSLAAAYILHTVDGNPLPYVLDESGGNRVELLNETLVLGGGHFTQQGNVRHTGNGQAASRSFAGGGTYTVNAGTIAFSFADGSSSTGAITDSTITRTVAGMTYEYRK